MKTPKISVIIPVHNAEKTLRRCLSSVLRQSYSNYEIIAVDNNSRDGSKQIINELQQKNTRLRYVFEPQIGRGNSRNAGIKAAAGEIVAMTDSDCIVEADWLKQLTGPIIYENESAAVGFEEDALENYWTKNIQEAKEDFIKRTVKGAYTSNLDTKNFAIKSSIIKKLMFNPDLSALEDFDLYIRLEKNTKIRFLPLVRVRHFHPSSFKELVKNNFERGFCVQKIIRLHKDNPNFQNNCLKEHNSLKSFLLFPFWTIFQFTKRSPAKIYFLFIAEASWRLGVLWGLITK